MSAVELEVVEHATGDAPRLSVIWLHGLGADGHDFEPVVDELGVDGLRFVFPHAPVRPITVNGGLPMRAWFDIRDFGADAPQDEPGIRESAASVARLIDREVERGMPAARVVLAGFSQGGAIALHTALRDERELAGVLALSAFVPLAGSLAGEISAANRRVPVFMAHGDSDPVIGIDIAQRGRHCLEALGYNVDWRSYPMAHAVCAEEIAEIAAWLRRLGRGAGA